MISDRCDMVDQWRNKGPSINGTWGIGHLYKKIKLDPFYVTYKNTQWIRELNMNDKTTQPLKGTVRE